MSRNTLVWGAVIVFLASLLSGCGWMAKELVQSGQSRLVTEPAEAQFHFVRTKVDAFARCMGTWGGTCDGRTEAAEPGKFIQPVEIFRELFNDSKAGAVPAVPELSEIVKQPAVSPAARVLTHPAFKTFGHVFNFVKGQPANELSGTKSKGGVPQFEFTRQELRNFSRDMEDAVRFDAFQTIYAGLDKAAKKLRSRSDLSEAQKSQLAAKVEFGKKMLAYIISYTKAYFREGEFVEIVLNTTDLENAIESRLGNSVPELKPDQRKELGKKLAAELPKDDARKIHLIGKVSETSFTTRGGANYKFPAITATLNPGSREFITVSKVDFVAVGADLIRVFLEAVGDALAGVPGVTDATGCKIKEEADEKDLRLPVFDPNNQATKLTIEDFGNVNEYANKVEGVVSSVTGRAIRGANWFSINNESLAVLIETAVGVIVKKVSEKVIWCGYCVARKEGANLTERDPTGVTTVVPHGIGRRAGETTVSANFVLVGEEGPTK